MSRSIDSRWSRTQKRYDRSQRVAKWTRSRYSDFASPYSRLAAYAPMDCQRQLQPAVRRFATWDRLKSRHSVKVTYPPAVLLPDRSTRAVVRSLCSASCKLQNPQLLDFGMMAFTSRQHALEMNCGSPAPSALSYWAALVPRGSHVREFAPYLIHLSIAIPIHLHSYRIGAYHMWQSNTRVSLLGTKRVFLVRFSAACSSNDLIIHPLCPTARPHSRPWSFFVRNEN
jgi:hypothetical protein